MTKTKELDSTYIPAGHYVGKTKAAKYLEISKGKLQYHIGKGHIETIKIEGMGHLIREKDVEGFVSAKPGKPSIYSKGRIWDREYDE